MKKKDLSGKLNLNKIKISKLQASGIKGGWISHSLSPNVTQPLCETDEYNTCQCNSVYCTDATCP